MKKSNLKYEVEKLIYTATHAKVEPNSGEGDDVRSLDDILEEGSKLSTTKDFNGFAKEISIDIANPEAKVEVNENNFIKLQGEAIMIRTLQIRLLMSDDVTEDKIKAFEESNLYKKCKSIEAGLEDFKKTIFPEGMPNFSGNLKSDDLELGSDDNQEKIKKIQKDILIKKIQEQIKSATAKLVEENNLKSLELNNSNSQKVAMMALYSNPIGLALINNSEKGIEIMKQTPFKAKATRLGATVGLLAATASVSALVFSLAVPAMTVALGGTIIAGVLALLGGSMITGTAGMLANKIGQKIPKLASKQEDNPIQKARADEIEKVEVSDQLSKNLLKNLNEKAKEYEKEISNNGKKQLGLS